MYHLQIYRKSTGKSSIEKKKKEITMCEVCEMVDLQRQHNNHNITQIARGIGIYKKVQNFQIFTVFCCFLTQKTLRCNANVVAEPSIATFDLHGFPSAVQRLAALAPPFLSGFVPRAERTPRLSSSRYRGCIVSQNMALHVPKAPGFAQMLKDGAKVRCNRE